MSASEITFLALGALLGGAAAAGLIGFVRARINRPNVRLTVAPNTVSPLMATTLSAAVGPWSDAARGGPADPTILQSTGDGGRATGAPLDPSEAPMGTHVLDREQLGAPEEPVGVPVEPEERLDFRTLIERRRPAAPLAARGIAPAAAAEPGTVAEPGAATEPGSSGLGALAGPGIAVLDGAPADVPAAGAMPASEPVASRAPDAPMDEEAEEPAATTASPPVFAPSHGAPSTAAIEEHRRGVRERCALADRLKAAALVAADTLRSEQRAYDVCLEQIRKEELAVDGRAIRAAKDRAQLEFRSARSAARSHADVEAAARRWLATIDEVNHAARVATLQLTRDRQAAARLMGRVERLGVEADAARIAAEAAAEACLAARQRLASAEQGIATEDEEAAAGKTAAQARLIPLDANAPLPFIVRLLRGDHGALLEIVARLSGDDREEQRRWQLHLATLVDGLVARALEMAWLDFPGDHPFWGMFSLQQDRDVAKSLGSLGYRFDGLGGFSDGRIPGQRELSLAVGYAGLDPMRIRRWPDQQGLADLYRGVRVEAAEFVAAEAPSLSLGQLVTLLGQRAERLTDLWNNWGRIRQILLAAS